MSPIKITWNQFEKTITIFYPWPFRDSMGRLYFEICGLEFGWISEDHPEVDSFKDF